MTYVKIGRQRSCKAMMNTAFLDKTTGAFEQINKTPWYLKIRNGTPGYFLKMDDKFQQMPENCFRATAARSAATRTGRSRCRAASPSSARPRPGRRCAEAPASVRHVDGLSTPRLDRRLRLRQGRIRPWPPAIAEERFAELDAEYDRLAEERSGLHDRPSVLPISFIVSSS